MSETPSEADALVRASFEVRDAYVLPDGEMEYRVSYGPGSKEAFVGLRSGLSPLGYTPWLQGTPEDASLLLRRAQEPVHPRSRFPILLLLFTLASVVAFSLLEELLYATFAPEVPSYAVVVGYSAGFLAILSALAFGHRYMADRRGSGEFTPYVIPGVPDVTAFLPSIGIVSTHRQPALNRDALFDVAAVGPLLAFAFSIALYAVGEAVAVTSSVPFTPGALINGYISVSQINPNLVQAAIDAALGQATSGGFFRLSPIMDAATAGFLLVFVNLIPISHFDGGTMFSAAFSRVSVRATTYLSVFALIALDTPNYWAIAIAILLISGRQSTTPLLDEVSPISEKKKAIFVLALILALLSFPIPQSLGPFPL